MNRKFQCLKKKKTKNKRRVGLTFLLETTCVSVLRQRKGIWREFTLEKVARGRANRGTLSSWIHWRELTQLVNGTGNRNSACVCGPWKIDLFVSNWIQTSLCDKVLHVLRNLIRKMHHFSQAESLYWRAKKKKNTSFLSFFDKALERTKKIENFPFNFVWNNRVKSFSPSRAENHARKWTLSFFQSYQRKKWFFNESPKLMEKRVPSWVSRWEK